MESLVEITSSKGCQLLIIKRVHRGSSSSMSNFIGTPFTCTRHVHPLHHAQCIHSLGCLSTLIGLTISVCLLYLLGISVSLNEY